MIHLARKPSLWVSLVLRIVFLVVAVFAVFALTLAYGEHQTRHFKRPSESAVTPAEPAKDRWLEAA